MQRWGQRCELAATAKELPALGRGKEGLPFSVLPNCELSWQPTGHRSSRGQKTLSGTKDTSLLAQQAARASAEPRGPLVQAPCGGRRRPGGAAHSVGTGVFPCRRVVSGVPATPPPRL